MFLTFGVESIQADRDLNLHLVGVEAVGKQLHILTEKYRVSIHIWVVIFVEAQDVCSWALIFCRGFPGC
jgi:hypothetical protein